MTMQLRIYRRSDRSLFEALASSLQKQLGGVWKERLDGFDQRYWDLLVDRQLLTVHLEHYLGIFVAAESTPALPSHELLERAAAAAPVQQDWTVTIGFSGLFSPNVEDSAAQNPLATGLTDENNHVHGDLKVLVNDRSLPQMGFWGPHDVCCNTWVVELCQAVRTLDVVDEGTYVFDEGEQGQPAFTFRRSSAVLFVSVEDSLISGGVGNPEWKDVPCEYEDFRFHVCRLRGLLRSSLGYHVGQERARTWFHDVDSCITQR